MQTNTRKKGLSEIYVVGIYIFGTGTARILKTPLNPD
jgi:hypothetical protein